MPEKPSTLSPRVSPMLKYFMISPKAQFHFTGESTLMPSWRSLFLSTSRNTIRMAILRDVILNAELFTVQSNWRKYSVRSPVNCVRRAAS